MPASILQLGCNMQCPHMGKVMVNNTNSRLRVDGKYALLVDDIYTIVGCSFMMGNTPHPCTVVEWQAPAQRIKVNGRGVLLETSIGMCKAADQMIQGKVMITGVQKRVKGM